MSIIDKFLGIFKHKEVVNEETVTEKVIGASDDKPVVVDASLNTPVMVRADDFADSSTTPEEYKVAGEEDVEVSESVVEETKDAGISVAEGDDMSPIIMDVEEPEEIIEAAEENQEVEVIGDDEPAEEEIEIL